MAGNNGIDDWEVVSDAGVDDWQPVGKVAHPDVEQAESAWRGASQGASFGFADELAGGLEAIGSKVGIRGLGAGFGDIRLETDEEDKQDFSEVYKQGRDVRRAADKAASAANPKTFLAGEVAGGLAVPLPGAAALKVGTTAAKIGKGVLAGAGVGALEAAGRTEESLTSAEGLKDVAGGALLGGAIGGAVTGVGALSKKLKDAITADPTKLRTSALTTTPTQRAKELLDPTLVTKKEAAIKAGEEAGVFNTEKALKSGYSEEVLKNTQDVLKEKGKEIEDIARITDFLLTRNNSNELATKFTKGLDAQLDKVVSTLLEKKNIGELSAKEFTRAKNFVSETYRVLGNRVTKKPALASIRDIKKGINKKLARKDYQPGGTKVGTQKDNLVTVAKSLGEFEREFVRNIKDTNIFPTANAERFSVKYGEALDTYSNLKTLEDELARVKEFKLFDQLDIAGGIGGAAVLASDIAGMGAVTTVAAIKKLYNVSQTPQGKLIIARFIDKGTELSQKNFAKVLGIPFKALQKVGIDSPKARQQLVKILEQQAVSSTTEE